jgi:hypothetical protein
MLIAASALYPVPLDFVPIIGAVVPLSMVKPPNSEKSVKVIVKSLSYWLTWITGGTPPGAILRVCVIVLM